MNKDKCRVHMYLDRYWFPRGGVWLRSPGVKWCGLCGNWQR